MGIFRIAVLGGVIIGAAGAQTVIPGDARRGEQLFRSESCVECHSLNGRGGKTAPDLGKRVDRNYTPAVMASVMWNHAPAMWTAMRQRGIEKPKLSPESAADLFAFFYSSRFFEKPGDAARGKQLFASKHCADCHGITESKAEGAPPVARWESLGDPIALVQQMWNHGIEMSAALKRRKIARPELSSQELTDMLVYLQNLPETRGLATSFTFGPAPGGQALFESKGCAHCHTGKLALENRLHNATLTDIAAAMWNHQPKMMKNPPVLSQEEMRQIVSYIWARQFFQARGNPERGKKVFEAKHCATCHNNPASGAPSLAGRGPFSDISMVSVLWDHGPRMLEHMQQQNIPWPEFTASQMSDLIAYLNSLR
jgi:mono/diheme cytochrome c family protein